MIEAFKPSETEARTYRFYRIPRAAVAGITINPDFANPTRDQRISLYTKNTAYLLSSALVMSSPTSSGPIRLAQHPSGLRTAILASPITSGNVPFVDNNGTHYGFIDAKGIGITPHCFRDSEERVDPADPLGFFGYKDALNDMSISNTFANHGGRTGRTLAIIALDHRPLSEWLRTLPMGEMLLDNLTKVIENSDDPAIAVRLLGAERIQDFWEAYDHASFYSRNKILQRGAKLLLSEITTEGFDNFSARYALDPKKFSIENLASFARNGFSAEAFASLEELYAQLFAANRNAAIKMGGNEKFAHIRPDVREHNADVAGFWYDWEGSHPDNGQYVNARFKQRMEKALDDYRKSI